MIYCKVPIRDVKDNLVFTVSRKPIYDPVTLKKRRPDLKIYVSWTVREPNENHHERLIEDVSSNYI